jgi:tetratricopeptide (TPR) repeat protein
MRTIKLIESVKLSLILIATVSFVFMHTIVYADSNSTLISKSEKAVLKVICPKDYGIIGTAFIISEDGYALSCYHVLEGINKYILKDIYGNKFDIDSIYGYSEKQDFILFKISSEEKKSFDYLEISDEDIYKGLEVIAIGHAAGYPYLATSGVVAGFRENSTFITEKNRSSILFTAPVYYASSGSPLINANNGKAIGIVSEITIIDYRQVPNINVSVDITKGIDYLKNIKAIAYNDFSFYRHEDYVYDGFDELDESDYDDSEYFMLQLIKLFIGDKDDYVQEARLVIIEEIIEDAQHLSFSGRFRAAIRKIKSAYRLVKNSDEKEMVIEQHLSILLSNNKLKRAEILLASLREEEPESHFLHHKLGNVYMLMGRPDLAEEYYEKSYNLALDYYKLLISSIYDDD